MGLKQWCCKCVASTFVLAFLVTAIVVRNVVYLPDVDVYIHDVPPRIHSNISYKPPKSQMRRQSLVREYCSSNEKPPEEFSPYMLLDESRQLAYCWIPKVGCTNWKRALILSTGMIKETDLNKILEPRSVNVDRNPSSFLHGSRTLFWKFHIYRSDEYTKRTLRRLLPNFFKFMFVRCPYERLLSGYRDKFERVDRINKLYYQQKFGTYIIRRYRANATAAEIQSGSTVTFSEFLQFIVDSVKEGRPLEKHWMPFHQICDPCVHNFSFIGKLETLKEDTTYVLDKIGANFAFPSSKSGPSSVRYGKNNSASLFEYYSAIPKALLHQVTQVYAKDFESFGYSKNLNQCSLGH